MHATRTLCSVLVLMLSLTACGGGGSGGLSGGIDDFGTRLPTDTPPTVIIHNTASSHNITLIHAYEAYTGEVYDIPVDVPPGHGVPISGFEVSQYDFTVYFDNGHRSDSATTTTEDPYNGSPITRHLPRVNPGEHANVFFTW